MGEINQQQSKEIVNTPISIPKNKRLANLKGPWKPGQSGNPKGRPKGVKNFDTLFESALKKIVEDNKINITDPERELVTKALIEGLKGNYSFYKDIMDRRYGQPKESIDHTFNLPQPILDVPKNDSNTKDLPDAKENQGGAGRNLSQQDNIHPALPDSQVSE